MKTVIEFLPNPATGEKQVLDLIRQLAVDGKADPHKMQLYMFIIVEWIF
jgi:hypothetical protein